MSEVRVQGYSFSLWTKVTLGVPKRIDVSLCPLTRMEARRAVANVGESGLVMLHGVFHKGREFVSRQILTYPDAYYFSPNGIGVEAGLLRRPELLRGPVRMMAYYTGKVPEGWQAGSEWLFSLTLQGPARVIERRRVAA
jgi:hypothetical protein